MKKFDKVSYLENGKWKFSGIIVDLIGDKAVVDTIVSGCYSIPIELLEPMSTANGILTLKNEVDDETLEKFKIEWEKV